MAAQTTEKNASQQWEEIKIPVPWGHIAGKWWGSKINQPIIAIHGWQDNCGTWDRLIPLLPPDVSVLAIDLPGHGLSSHYPTGQIYYIFWDGVLHVRRIVKYFNWKKVTILGHSLGGCIGFIYSGTFPNEVEKLIQIDIVSPTVRDVKASVQMASLSVDRFLKYETLTDADMPCYEYDEMVNLIEAAYKGSVTKESCKILLKRGMQPNPKGKGYLFSRDVRLKVAGLGFLSLDLVLEYASNIRCPVLNIKGNPGMTFDKPEYYHIVLDKIKQHAQVEFHEVPGTHHLHLNSPEKISGIVTNFLKKPDSKNYTSS